MPNLEIQHVFIALEPQHQRLRRLERRRARSIGSPGASPSFEVRIDLNVFHGPGENRGQNVCNLPENAGAARLASARAHRREMTRCELPGRLQRPRSPALWDQPSDPSSNTWGHTNPEPIHSLSHLYRKA